MSERASASQSDKAADSNLVTDSQLSSSHRKVKKHTRGDSAKAEEHADAKHDATAQLASALSSSTRGSDRRKAKKSKREASDRSRRSSGESGAESDTSGMRPFYWRRTHFCLLLELCRGIHLLMSTKEMPIECSRSTSATESSTSFDLKPPRFLAFFSTIAPQISAHH